VKSIKLKKFNNKKKDIYKNLFEIVTLISSCEKTIIKFYDEDEMKTPMHMSFGDENCVAGIVESLRNDCFFLGYYRSHSLYLAVSRDPHSFFAEMLGKETGSNGGIAGSMHMSSIENGLLNSSAIVASTLPLSLGAGFSSKTIKKKNFTTIFFGDGAIEEGVFHETINMACLLKLPILFVCLDNDLAVDIKKKARQGFRSIKELVKSYRCEYLNINYPDAIDSYNIAEKAKNIIKEKNCPVFIHMKYYRYLQHIGIRSDFEKISVNKFEKKNYRSNKIHKKFLKQTPLQKTFNKMLINGLNERELKAIKKKILTLINKAFQKAKNDEFNNVYDLNNKVFYNKK